jgi:hypothetical protein
MKKSHILQARVINVISSIVFAPIDAIIINEQVIEDLTFYSRLVHMLTATNSEAPHVAHIRNGFKNEGIAYFYRAMDMFVINRLYTFDEILPHPFGRDNLKVIVIKLLFNFIFYPLETIRVRLITQERVWTFNTWSSIKELKVYTSTFDYMIQEVRKKKVKRLYAGIISSTLEIITRSLVHVAIDKLRSQNLSPVFFFVLKSSIASIASLPFVIIKRRMQADVTKLYDNDLYCARQLYNRYGMRGFFKGIWHTTLRDIANDTFIKLSFELCH